MRAVVLRSNQLVVDDVPTPSPGTGQVLVRTRACGICGSDLHFRVHGGRMLELGRQSGGRSTTTIERDIVMGHEFVGEVLELGPDAHTSAKPGDLVVSMPVMLTTFPPEPGAAEGIGYSNVYPGGYSEAMVLSGPLLLPVPNGLDVTRAALTEPLAVGIHAVNKSGITAADAAVVHGAGPVGLAVIVALRHLGVGCVIASDFSPARRQLAERLGATSVVDPAVAHPLDVAATEAGSRSVVQFEAVGVPGVLDDLMRRAPRDGRIVVVGVCMEADRINPFFGIAKELSLQFVLGYSAEEFASSLRVIAEGEVDVDPMITGTVDLDGVPGAFTELATPERHAKIIVVPA